ncbi:MAG: hypothetical protein WCQ89_23880 [Verrucomicrobiota bacterium]
MNRKICVLLPAVLLLSACATIPDGPGVLVLPGTGKSFDEFKANDFECRHYASSQIGGSSPNDAAANDGVKSAAVGAAVGAAAGALIGGGRGAGTGAGAGGWVKSMPNAFVGIGTACTFRSISAAELDGESTSIATSGAPSTKPRACASTRSRARTATSAPRTTSG